MVPGDTSDYDLVGRSRLAGKDIADIVKAARPMGTSCIVLRSNGKDIVLVLRAADPAAEIMDDDGV